MVGNGRAAVDFCEGFDIVHRMMLFAVATTARNFLLPHWSRWHHLWGPPLPAMASQWTYVRSSIFLVKVLHRYGIDAKLQSGQPPKEAPIIASEKCGLFTADGWMGHAWVEANGFVVDITADQFGHAPVIVTPADDTTYQPSRNEAHRLTATENGIAAIDEIWPSWWGDVDRRFLLVGGNSEPCQV